MPNDPTTPPPPADEAGQPISFSTLRSANAERHAEWWDGSEPPSLSFRGNELAGETGEACNVLKKIERERIGMRGSRATKEQAAEELADIVICTDLVAMDLGVDLGAAVANKFNATSEKYGLATRLSAAQARASAAEVAGLKVENKTLYGLIGESPPEEWEPRGKSWHHERAQWSDRVAGLTKRVETLGRERADHDRLRAALNQVEWGGTRRNDRENSETPACPDCGHTRSEGHADGCVVAAALAPSASPGAAQVAAAVVPAPEGTAEKSPSGRAKTSCTYGDLPDTIQPLVEPHYWDNMNPIEQRDWLVIALINAIQAAEHWADQARAAAALSAPAGAGGEWISPGQRPTKYAPCAVLRVFPGGSVGHFVAHWSGQNWRFGNEIFDVVGWLPLPVAPSPAATEAEKAGVGK